MLNATIRAGTKVFYLITCRAGSYQIQDNLIMSDMNHVKDGVNVTHSNKPPGHNLNLIWQFTTLQINELLTDQLKYQLFFVCVMVLVRWLVWLDSSWNISLFYTIYQYVCSAAVALMKKKR